MTKNESSDQPDVCKGVSFPLRVKDSSFAVLQIIMKWNSEVCAEDLPDMYAIPARAALLLVNVILRALSRWFIKLD